MNVEAERTVTVAGFALMRHPITQAQWRAVATLPPLDHDLSVFGSYKPDDLWERHAQPGWLPVESVSWIACQEWLQRLNQWLSAEWTHLGGQGDPPRLALPGEGQWEMACRAGASTPFHFGDTIDATWANYAGTDSFGLGRKGANRQRPMPGSTCVG